MIMYGNNNKKKTETKTDEKNTPIDYIIFL